MKNDKQFYKDLPTVNGYKWSLFDNDKGLHYFTKQSQLTYLWSTCKVTENDIETGEFIQMLEQNLSRK